jgi:hypothetical protein
MKELIPVALVRQLVFTLPLPIVYFNPYHLFSFPRNFLKEDLRH